MSYIHKAVKNDTSDLIEECKKEFQRQKKLEKFHISDDLIINEMSKLYLEVGKNPTLVFKK